MPLVLGVDDDPTIRSVLSEVFGFEGYQVSTAEHGGVALAIVEGPPPDAIVTDLMMPVLDGWTFMERCRQVQACAEIPIIVLSAASDLSENAERLKEEHGVYACIAKPFDVDRLLNIVERCASRS